MSASTLTVTVLRKWTEAHDICGFEFRTADGSPLPAFSAGSHIDVYLPGGLVRQYSLCNDPTRADSYQIAVLRNADGRGGSMSIHDLVQQGDVVRISTPKNHFPIAHDAPHHLLLAGGIGITPILCMAQHLSASGDSFSMHYCTRSMERTAFLEQISHSTYSDQVRFHFDDGEPSQRFDLATTLAKAPPGTHLYVCGPRGLMDAVLAEARGKNWTEDLLHYEFFSGVAEKPETDMAFQIRLASSGALIDVPSGCTVVEALSAHGIEVLTSCGQGVCGTCVTRVLQGRPDHRDSYLTEEEKAAGDQFMPCCSRSSTPELLLDL